MYWQPSLNTMTNENTQNDYATSDAWLASVLMALGEKLLDVERNNGSQRALFVFERSNGILEHIEGYKRGELRLEPQNLFVQNKLLKNRLYASY